MSLPVVLPGSCCPVAGASQLAEEPPYRSRARGLAASSRLVGAGPRRLLLPGRPLLSLGLLQLLLGACMVALSFGALSLSNSAPIRNSCPFWAGSSVILSGIVGLTTWRRPMLLLVNVFVLLSVVCVLLNLAGFILCCQGAQLVSSMTSCRLSEAGDICYCCALSPSTKCPEEKLLQLHPAHSCSTMRILLKKVLFALCALNALTTAVCLMAAALRYLQIFTARTPCMEEPRAAVEEREEAPQVPDPEEFVAPAPPPSYFSTFYSYTPRLARRMLWDSVIPLPHIYGARIKGVEVFCPLDPPPPYETVAGSSGSAVTQATEEALTEATVNSAPSPPSPPSPPAASETECPSARAPPELERPPASPPELERPPASPPELERHQGAPALVARRRTRVQRSNSDPVLMDLSAKDVSVSLERRGPAPDAAYVPAPARPPAVPSSADAPAAAFPRTADSSTQTSQPRLAACAQGQVTLRRGNRDGKGPRGPRRPRPSSMVDYQSYRHTQQLVRDILEQPAAQGLAPEVQELVESIRLVLQSDQEHMEEAVRSASYIEQAFSDSEAVPGQPRPAPHQQEAGPSSQTLPRPPRRRPGLLHLRSCGDLSSFTCSALQSAEQQRGNRRAGPRAGHRTPSRTGSRPDQPGRPHSLIGVFRETVL